jgi:Carboxypeptidase regulatory-like domain
MYIKQAICFLFLCITPTVATAQEMISAPEPQTGSITGTIMDTDGAAIPGAKVLLTGASPIDHQVVIADDHAFFVLSSVHPATSYHVTVSAKGFADWTSSAITLSPGQTTDLKDIHLIVAAIETAVTAVFSEQLALEQIKVEEKQRVFGIIPNFYVVYDQQFVPLTTKLKFRLAFRAATDVATISAAAALAGINQAADNPDYVQGAKGYGQRFGAAYATGFSNILIGGAVLPSLLHQDPRYFYQGTGTTKSRALHAISSPFVAKGDNGHWQFNYSSVGGDLVSGALSNLYYPSTNRGAGLVFESALVTTGGRMINALAQEFILRRFTTKTSKQTTPAEAH